MEEAFQDALSKMNTFTPKQIEEHMKKKSGALEIWIIFMYLPWCPHCHHAAPNLLPLTKQDFISKYTNENCKFGAINAEEHAEFVMKTFNVSGFPQVFFVDSGNPTPCRYKGSMNAEKIMENISVCEK